MGVFVRGLHPGVVVSSLFYNEKIDFAVHLKMYVGVHCRIFTELMHFAVGCFISFVA